MIEDDGMAAIIAANPVEAPTEPEEKPEPVVEAEETADEPETDEAEPEVDETDEPEDDKRRRNKPASQRIAEVVAQRKAVERERDAALAEVAALKNAPKAEVAIGEPPVKPDPADFDYGTADEGYIDKLTDWKLDMREHEARKAQVETDKANAAQSQQRQMVERLQDGIGKAEATAKAKYDDFDTKVADAVAARGGDPLPPLLAVGISISPVGGDLIYRLATDQAASERLERLSNGGQQTSKAMARAFGELEAEYLDNDDDDDLDLEDPLDMARLVGRMNTRIKGVKAAPKLRPTNAPEPPAHRARGSGGRFDIGADTTDFAAFERKANAR